LFAIAATAALTSCKHLPWQKVETVDTVKAVAPVMVDANLYQIVITRADSLQTEYSVYAYATDKWDASRIGETKYLNNEPVGSTIRIVLITPINSPFKCPESIIQKDVKPDSIVAKCKSTGKKHIEYTKGPKKSGKGKGGCKCLFEYNIV